MIHLCSKTDDFIKTIYSLSKTDFINLMRGNGTLLDRCHVAPQRNTCFLVLERCWSRNKLKMIVSYSHMTVVRLQAEG